MMRYLSKGCKLSPASTRCTFVRNRTQMDSKAADAVRNPEVQLWEIQAKNLPLSGFSGSSVPPPGESFVAYPRCQQLL